jgi:hypothetical protein
MADSVAGQTLRCYTFSKMPAIFLAPDQTVPLPDGPPRTSRRFRVRLACRLAMKLEPTWHTNCTSCTRRRTTAKMARLRYATVAFCRAKWHRGARSLKMQSSRISDAAAATYTPRLGTVQVRGVASPRLMSLIIRLWRVPSKDLGRQGVRATYHRLARAKLAKSISGTAVAVDCSGGRNG